MARHRLEGRELQLRRLGLIWSELFLFLVLAICLRGAVAAGKLNLGSGAIGDGSSLPALFELCWHHYEMRFGLRGFRIERFGVVWVGLLDGDE